MIFSHPKYASMSAKQKLDEIGKMTEARFAKAYKGMTSDGVTSRGSSTLSPNKEAMDMLKKMYPGKSSAELNKIYKEFNKK